MNNALFCAANILSLGYIRPRTTANTQKQNAQHLDNLAPQTTTEMQASSTRAANTENMRTPPVKTYLNDTKPASMLGLIGDTFRVFKILRVIPPLLSTWNSGHTTVLPLDQRDDYRLVAAHGAHNTRAQTTIAPPLPPYFLGRAYYMCAQITIMGLSYLNRCHIPERISGLLQGAIQVAKIEKKDANILLHKAQALYQDGTLGEVEGFSSGKKHFFGEIEKERLSLSLKNTDVVYQGSIKKLIGEIERVTSAIDEVKNTHKSQTLPLQQGWQNLFTNFDRATKKVLIKDINISNNIGSESIHWLKDSFSVLKTSFLGNLMYDTLFLSQPQRIAHFNTLTHENFNHLDEQMNDFFQSAIDEIGRKTESFSPLSANDTVIDLNDKLEQLSAIFSEYTTQIFEAHYQPVKSVPDILSALIENNTGQPNAAQPNAGESNASPAQIGFSEVVTLVKNNSIAIQEEHSERNGAFIKHFFALPMVLEEFSSQGKTGTRIFKETLRQNLDNLHQEARLKEQAEQAPINPPTEEIRENTEQPINSRARPLQTLRHIFSSLFSFLHFWSRHPAQPPVNSENNAESSIASEEPNHDAEIMDVDENTHRFIAKQSGEERLMQALRKDLKHAIEDGALWSGINDANALIKKEWERLHGVIDSLPLNLEAKDALKKSIDSGNIADIANQLNAHEQTLSQGIKNYLKVSIYRTIEANAMRELLQTINLFKRENRTPTEVESNNIQGLSSALTNARVLLMGLNSTHFEVQKAEDPNYWILDIKSHESLINNVYAKDAKYTTLTDDQTLEFMNNALSKGIAYHQYSVEGLNNIPKEGRCLVAFNHSMSTYEVALFGNAAVHSNKRLLRMLVHDNFFKYSSSVAKEAEKIGFIPAKRDTAVRLLENEQLTGVCPGGIKEAVKPSNQYKHAVMWDNTKGFARISLLTGAPIVLAACPAANDLYEVTPSKITNFVVKNAALPAPIISSAAFPAPNNTRLTHYLSPPIYPPKLPDKFKRALDLAAANPEKTNPEFKAMLDQYHAEVFEKMKQLMTHGIAQDTVKAQQDAVKAQQETAAPEESISDTIA